MFDAKVWWLLAGAAAALELVSGTYFLLALVPGFAAGAIAAHLGLAQPVQVGIAAVVGIGGALLWRLRQRRHAQTSPASSNADVNIDIGAMIQIDAWQPDGTAQVRYRGALWTAQLRPGNPPLGGMHRVTELVGNRLVVEHV